MSCEKFFHLLFGDFSRVKIVETLTHKSILVGNGILYSICYLIHCTLLRNQNVFDDMAYENMQWNQKVFLPVIFDDSVEFCR